MTWTSLVRCTALAGRIEKTGTPDIAWNAGGVSAQRLASGDGWAQATALALSKNGAFGLSSGDTDQFIFDIDFNVYLDAAGLAKVYEGASLRWTDSAAWSTTDVWRVAIESGAVKYRKNGSLVYSSAVDPTYPILVDTSFYNIGAGIIATLGGGAWS